jgi:hypothetical protein
LFFFRSSFFLLRLTPSSITRARGRCGTAGTPRPRCSRSVPAST